MKFSEFAQDFLAHSVTYNKPSTVKAKRLILAQTLLPFFGGMTVSDIGPVQVRRFVSGLEAGSVSNKTINNHLIVLRAMLNLAAEWEVRGPAPKVRLLPVRQGDTPVYRLDDLATLFGAMNPPWRQLFTVLFHTGLRVGELRALRWEDVDLANGTIRVGRSDWCGIEGTPKSGKVRLVGANQACVQALASLPRHGVYVCTKGPGLGVYTYTGFRQGLARAIEKTGLTHFRIHGFRHAFASWLMVSGVPLGVVSQLLGHSDIKMTMRYAHLSPEAGDAAVKAIETLITHNTPIK